MLTRGWLLGAVLASALGCGSRSTGGDSDKSNQAAGSGGTLGVSAPSGGAGGRANETAGGGSPAAGGRVGVGAGGTTGGGGMAVGGAGPTGCMEMTVTCTAFVTIPIVSLPDGTLITCAGTSCLEQAVVGGHIASGRVELVDGELRATWRESGFGFLTPSCVDPAGNSFSFRSSGGAVVVLFSGNIPLVVSDKPCRRESEGGVVLTQQPVDIAALVQAAEEGGAGGEGGGGGVGNESGGGSGGAL
ncbi:MAG: hypothetical protein ABUL60_08385 [Myxococcales bacterium]